MKKEVMLFKVGGGVINSPEAFDLFVLDVFRKITSKRESEKAKVTVIVISAFGKVTQLIEELVGKLHDDSRKEVERRLSELAEYFKYIAGREIIHSDFPEGKRQLELFRDRVLLYRSSDISDEMNAELQQFGEMISSKIVEDILRAGSTNKGPDYIRFLDSRDFIRTNGSVLSGEVDKNLSLGLFEGHTAPLAPSPKKCVIVCPGYVAMSVGMKPSLLGKEGSDYTAALVAYFVERSSNLSLSEVVFFKASSGISLDFQGDDSKIDPYVTWDEVEKLVFAGAKVIHPTAVRMLREMGQPVLVVSLENFLKNGTSTIIHSK